MRRVVILASNTMTTPRAKQPQFIYWTFTLPVTSDFWGETKFYDIEYVREILSSPRVKAWIFQVECGDDSDYLHHQGWLQCHKKERLAALQKFFPKEAHLEVSRGPAAEAYAHKLDTRISGPFSFPYRYVGADIITVLRPWQTEVVNIIKQRPDPRVIHWYYEPHGNTGKSALTKYLVWHFKAIVVGGRSADALFAAVNGSKMECPIYIIDLARTTENNVCYEAIEMLKNGCGFSQKYESGMFLGPIPHIIIFANFEPDESKLSADRWHKVLVNRE